MHPKLLLESPQSVPISRAETANEHGPLRRDGPEHDKRMAAACMCVCTSIQKTYLVRREYSPAILTIRTQVGALRGTHGTHSQTARAKPRQASPRPAGECTCLGIPKVLLDSPRHNSSADSVWWLMLLLKCKCTCIRLRRRWPWWPPLRLVVPQHPLAHLLLLLSLSLRLSRRSSDCRWCHCASTQLLKCGKRHSAQLQIQFTKAPTKCVLVRPLV
jgi:hypothetical protein